MNSSLSPLRRFFRSLVRWLDEEVATHLRPGRRRSPLLLEELELRMVPAAITWINRAGGDWDTATNWSSGTVPTAADDVSIPINDIVVTHSTNANDAVNSLTSAASFSLSAGSLSIGTTGQFNSAFTESGGALSGAGSITMSGPTTWSGGTMSGTGVTSLDGNSTISAGTLDTGTLNNFGTVSQVGDLTNDAVINNESGATWNLSFASNNLFVMEGSGTFNNLGTLTSSNSAGTSTFLSTTYNNNGNVFVQSGTFDIGADAGTDNGTDSITSGATLQFGGGGTYNLNTDSNVTGPGGVIFSSDTVNVAGGFTPTGPIVSLGTTSFTNSVNNTGDVTFSTLSLEDGQLLGDGTTITVTGAMTWSGGFLSGTAQSGALQLDLEGSTSISSPGGLLFTFGTLNNFGTITQNNNLNPDSVIVNNESGATWNLLDGSSMDGSDTFNDFGTLTTTGSSSIDNGSFLLSAIGTLNGAGTITFGGGTQFTWSGGTMSGSGVTDLLGSSTFFASGSIPATLDTRTLNNFGTLTSQNVSIPIINGAVINNESGAIWNLETTDLETGTVNNFGTLTVSGGLNQLNGQFTPASITNADTVTVAANSMFTFATFTQSAGLLQGSGVLDGNVTINGGVVYPGASDPTPGVMTVNGNYTQGANTSLDELIEGTTSGTQYSVLDVSGTATLGGTLNIQLGNGFVPSPGATFQIVTADSVSGTFATVNGLTINGSESFTLSYTATSATLTVSGAAVPSAITATSGGGQTATVNTAFANPLVATVTDANGNPISGVQVTFAVVPSSGGAGATFDGQLPFDLVMTNAQGQASVTVTANATAGSYTVTASDAPTLSTSAAFSLTNTAAIVPPPPASPPPASPPPTSSMDRIGLATPEPNGTLSWTLYPSLDSLSASGSTSFTYGLSTDFPLVGDWIGDGTDEVGIVRATTGGGLQWVLDTNGDDAYDAGDSVYAYGLDTDVPVIGDWTGNGKTKIGVVQPGPNGTAQWVLNTSGSGVYSSTDVVTTFGFDTDKFGAGNWTGGDKDSLAVVRAAPGGALEWVLDTAGLGYYVPGDAVYTFGLASDTPIVGDWNGAGKTEIGVERTNANGTVTFVLDTNGDGVYNAGDQVFTLSASSAATFEFGNWHALSGMPSTPVGANPFAGTYAGTFTGTATTVIGTVPVSGSTGSTVDSNGNITVTSPGSGSGTVSTTGVAQISGTGQIGGVQNASYTFDGTFVLGSDGSATVSGTWTATFTGGSASGTWSGSRTS